MLNLPRLFLRNKTSLHPKPPMCPVCSNLVALENANTDENGKAIHEECYLLKVGLKASSQSLGVIVTREK